MSLTPDSDTTLARMRAELAAKRAEMHELRIQCLPPVKTALSSRTE